MTDLDQTPHPNTMGESSRSRPAKLDRLWQAVITITAAVITAYAGYWFGRQPETVSAIEYRIYYEENLTRQLGRENDFKITYKGVEQPGLSRVEVVVKNTSDRNLDKIRIYLQLRDNSVTPLISDFTSPDGYPRDLIRRISAENGMFTYEIDYMNRTNSSVGFSFYFYFAQAKPPEVSVSLGAKGVTLRKYDPDGAEYSSLDFWLFVLRDSWAPLAGLIATAVFAIACVRIMKRIQRENAKRYVFSLLPEDLDEAERVKRAEVDTEKLFEEPKFKAVVARLFKGRE